MFGNYKRLPLLFIFAITFLVHLSVFADEQKPIIQNVYSQYTGSHNRLGKEGLKELQYYLDRVTKFSDDLNDYVAIGALGNRETVKFLEDFLQNNEENSTYGYKSVVQYYVFGSLVLLGERQYIDDLIEGLCKNVPEYSDWLKKGCVNANPNWMCSEVLRCLSSYGITFDARHIDKMIETLNHPHGTVAYNVQYVLNVIFGILFPGRGENNWIYQSEEVRLPHIKAWKKFWEQNRARYGSGSPLIINDLELQAQYEVINRPYLVITMINHGDTAWDAFVEAPGEFDDKNLSHYGSWNWMSVFAVLADGDIKTPIVPRQYIHPARILSEDEWAKRPDRIVHIEKITLAAGGSYTYTMDLNQAFPNTEFKTGNICVRYRTTSYDADQKVLDDSKVWQGELRSEIITIK